MWGTSSGFALLEFFGEGRDDFEQVADDSVVCDLENWRVLILVDRDNCARALHPHDVLDGSADSEREVQLGGDRLPRAPDLTVHRQPAFIADRTRCRQFPA